MVKFIAKFSAKYFIPISVLVIMIVIIAGLRFALIKVHVDQIGVKTAIWGIKRGVVQKDFAPGWHRFIRKVESWDLFDGTVQTFNMTREARTKEGKIESRELPIRTADDYNVTVDIVVKYQIKKGEAHKIRQEIGPGDRYKSFVESEIRDVARHVLGKMTEKNLYDPTEKRKRAEESKQLLAARLQVRHVIVIDWLILDMRFDPQLERKIKNIKLAGLDELLNISQARAVEKRGITQTIDAATEALAEKIQADKEGQKITLRANMDTKVTEILASANMFMIGERAEGDLYKEERRAAGELLIERAIAEGERLRRQAMSGVGGDMIVALEAARNINLGEVILSTQDVDLLDIEMMIDKLGASTIGKYDSTKIGKLSDFFKPTHKMPKELHVPDGYEKELEDNKPGISKELKYEFEHTHPEMSEDLKEEIIEEWENLTEEYPVNQ